MHGYNNSKLLTCVYPDSRVTFPAHKLKWIIYCLLEPHAFTKLMQLCKNPRMKVVMKPIIYG